MLKPLWPAGSPKSGRIQPSQKETVSLIRNLNCMILSKKKTASECRGTEYFENLNSQKDKPKEVDVISLYFVNERNVEPYPQIKDFNRQPIMHRSHWHKMPVFRNFIGTYTIR
jgi:hypothetical protein